MKRFNKKLYLLSFLLFFPLWLLSKNIVDTVTVYSERMDKQVKNIVILPKDYNSNIHNKYPVVYLLHGYSANYGTWLNVIKKNLPELATIHNFIIVCPDGANSWYWDSPIDKKSVYDAYISSELISYIDSEYRTIKLNTSRAITGFSMGGHGALWLTMEHPDIFGACGSMSGGVDIRPFPRNWGIYRLIGSYNTNKLLWDKYTVFTNVEKLKNKSNSIIIDCGESDFFLDVNEKFHQKLLEQNISHVYITSEGSHKPSYWRKAIDQQLKFFSKYFDRMSSLK